MIATDEILQMMEREAGAPDSTDPLYVGFGFVPIENAKKSKEAGHPVFEDREYVKIEVPGDRKSIFCQPATDAHRRRFPRAYTAFKDRTADHVALVGTPIEEWPQVSRAMAMTLRAASVHTVEAMAAMSDAHVDNVGGRELRTKAKAYLAVAQDSAAAHKMAAEGQRKDDQITDLQRQINELSAHLLKQGNEDAGAKRKPGRPRGAQQSAVAA